MCCTYHIDGFDYLEVGGEDDNQWQHKTKEVDVSNIGNLK